MTRRPGRPFVCLDWLSAVPRTAAPATGQIPGAGTVPGMDFWILAAKPWAYWISPMLAAISVLAILGVILAYVFKVVAAKYPKT